MEYQCRICGGPLGFVQGHTTDFCARCERDMKDVPSSVRAVIFSLCERIEDLEKKTKYS